MKWLCKRLRQIATMELSREELLMKLGGAQSKAPAAWRLVNIKVEKERPSFTFKINRKKLRKTRRREGRYLLRTNLTDNDPAQLWQYYVQLVAVEEAFRNLKGNLAIRPVFHQDETRIEAHILVCSSDYSWFGRVADGRRHDLRRLGVRTAVSLDDIRSRRDAIVPAMPMAA
jgi:hypothetical protein